MSERITTTGGSRRRLNHLAARKLSYPEVGGTRRVSLPEGYRHIRRVQAIGAGEEIFRRAGVALDDWSVHRAAGLRVISAGPATMPGADALLLLGGRRLHVAAACRVVYVIREPHRHGFAYGTLEGHPECGEESFVVCLDSDGRVTFSIIAFSRPRSLPARATGPLTHVVQEIVTRRYLAAMRQLAGRSQTKDLSRHRAHDEPE